MAVSTRKAHAGAAHSEQAPAVGELNESWMSGVGTGGEGHASELLCRRRSERIRSRNHVNQWMSTQRPESFANKSVL